MKRNFSLWLAALLALMLFSCNKELAEDLVATESEQIAEARAALKTPEEVNFFDFNYLSVTNPHLHQELSFRDGEEDSLILALADRILLQNATHGFVPELVNKIGYPIWDRSKIIYAQDNYNHGVIIPFAKSDDSFIRAFLFAVPFSQDWIFLLKDKSTLLSAMQSSLSQAQADTLAWTAISYLNIDQQLFETRDISIESWLRAYAGGSSGFSNQEDNLNSRCNVIVYTTGTCIYTAAFSPDTPEEEVNFRGPCPQNYMWVESLAIIRHCGGGGGNWWGGVSDGGSNCLGCPGSPWNDPAIAQQVQRCELISDIANGQIPGSLGQFSQAEIDLCNNLSTLMEQLVLSADNVKFLIENLDQLAILTAYFSSGIATLADQNAAIAFMNLRQEGKISMTLREFMALHRLVFGELVPELGLTVLEGEWLLENGTIAQEIADLLENHQHDNISKTASITYLNLVRQNDAEINEFIEDFNALEISDPLWTILKELLADAFTELLQEQLADLIPGGSIVTIGPLLLDNLQQGNMLDALYNLVDIVLNEADIILPWAKVASLGIAVYDKYKLLTKVYKGFKQLKSAGQESVMKLYDNLKQHLGGPGAILRKWKWDGGQQSILEGVNREQFFEDLKNRFSINGVFTYQGNPVFKLYQIPNNPSGAAVYITAYSTSETADPNTGLSYPLSIKFYIGPGTVPPNGTNPNSSLFSTVLIIRLR